MNIRFNADARADIENLRRYLETRNPLAYQRIASRLDTVLTLLREFPLIGRSGRVEGTREMAVTSTPYLIVYHFPYDTEIDVLNILHGRQKYPPERS